MAVSRINEAGLNVNQYGNRNIIINGGMQVWQRATAATTVVNNTYQTVDRFSFFEDSDGSYTTEQSTGHRGDTGHENALKCVCTGTDTSLAAAQFASVSYRIEAQNLQHLRYGTSNAKTLTCSFWVRSSKTGIYSFSLVKNDATAHYFVSEYTISAADTWEHKTISIPVLTGSSITNDNGAGLSIEFALAYGSTYRTSTLDQWMTAQDFASTNQVNWLDSTSNNWYLTGVQLEVGDTATDFEHRTFDDELQRCRRYAYLVGKENGKMFTSACFARSGYLDLVYGSVPLLQELRASPTLTYGGNIRGTNFTRGYSTKTTTGLVTYDFGSTKLGGIRVTFASDWTAGDEVFIGDDDGTGFILLDAEL